MVGTVTPRTGDELLLKMATPYDYILYFLWACHHLDKDVKTPTMITLQDEMTLYWERKTHDQCIKATKPPVTFDLSKPQASSDLLTGTILAMTKLSQSMIKHQESVLKSQEEKSDSCMTAWR